MTRAPNQRLRRPPATPSAPLEDAVCVTQGVDRGPPGLEGIGRPWQMPRKGSAPLKWMRLPDRYASWDPPSGSRGAKASIGRWLGLHRPHGHGTFSFAKGVGGPTGGDLSPGREWV